MELSRLIEIREAMPTDPEYLDYYARGDKNSHWQTRHDAHHGEEVHDLGMKSLLPQLEQVFGPLVDEVTREFVLPTALRSHDVGRAIDIDKHDTEGARVMKDYLQKREVPHEVLAHVCRLIVHHRSNRVLKHGILDAAHAILVIADKCIGDERRVREDKATKLNLLRRIGIRNWTLARRNWWFNAAHDRVNFAIKEAKVQVDVEQNPGHRKPTGEIVLKMTIDEKVASIKEIVSLDWFADSFHACGKAAEFFGLFFRLEFNGVRYKWTWIDKATKKGAWLPLSTTSIPR